ncbi:hypothetical protein D9757_008022 [Collybiopsis confluens]|uniref:U2A'/phosphoprotein 32 family A C-terminal domain-containing protein n=1 Tax=Collybiopsis confluens TaxID=2823264 RepID=A0A8H5H610_9AGAR|nr:hypothetical protein D9757_008022 [Collybiopsis confluens]
MAEETTQNAASEVERSARLVLPAPELSSDEEEDVEEKYEVEEGDFLQDWPDETEDLELVHSRLGSLDELRLSRFANHLKRLCLRQNHISFLDPQVFHLLIKLEELDLYDNKIKDPGSAMEKLSNLLVLDLSFNLVKSIPESIAQLKSLKTVYFVQNRILKITGLDSLTSLRSLELGGNRIRKIENLDALVNLEELWLGKNKITKLENLSSLGKLRILSIQSNRITVIEGLEGLSNLEELYLSHNGVKKLEGLDRNTKLRTLDVGNNFISAIENISHLTQMEELWMNGNQVPDLHALDPQLAHIPTLETLYLEGNPCHKNDASGYRRKIILALKQLKQIDATYVKV